MAVSIRLRREGAKNNPYYRIVVASKQGKRDGKFIEQVGTYDPKKKEGNFNLKLDRVEHWIGVGAQPSDTVASFVKRARKAKVAAEQAAVA
ncbi:MAG: 30S ribosomal protein S16 [Candidatus Methylacidiphilales bacterium]|nr:30S ribosomal protein S16 [Candidatus Methylacidiphilales bacterium]